MSGMRSHWLDSTKVSKPCNSMVDKIKDRTFQLRCVKIENQLQSIGSCRFPQVLLTLVKIEYRWEPSSSEFLNNPTQDVNFTFRSSNGLIAGLDSEFDSETNDRRSVILGTCQQHHV